MNTATTRRAVLAGAAALPALAMPAIAGPAATDPIFAAIEAHRSANTAFSELLHRKSELELKHPSLWRREFPGMNLDGDEFKQIPPGPGVLPFSIRKQKDVDEVMRIIATESNRSVPRAELKRIEASLRARLRKEMTDYKGARAAAGLDAMDRAEWKYCNLEDAAGEAMLGCQPTTRAGLAAFLAYVVEFQVDRGDPNEMQDALETAAAAAKALG